MPAREAGHRAAGNEEMLSRVEDRTVNRRAGARLARCPCLLMLSVALCSAVAMTGCRSTPPASAPEAVPVNVAAVVQKDVPVQLHAIGNVDAYSTVTLKSHVDGQLAQINFQEGQEVHEGDLLFVIDPRPFQATLQQAEANLAKDRAEATNAQVQAERYQRLLANNFVSKDQYDQVRTQAESLGAAAKANQAAVENTKLLLQYCYIHAPITGRIGQFLLHVGNMVKNLDTTLATINRIRPVYVAFAVPEQQLPEIRSSAAARPRSRRPVRATFSATARRVIDQGDFTILACLQQHRPKLSAACNQVLKSNGQ